MLRWPPDAFWRATPWEVARAYDGWAKSKGIKTHRDPNQYPDKQSREELHRKLIDRHGHD